MGEFDNIRLGDYWITGLVLEVTCRECGHTRILHASELLRLFPGETRLGELQLGAFAMRLKCARCDAREPELEVISRPA